MVLHINHSEEEREAVFLLDNNLAHTKTDVIDLFF